MNFFDDLDAPPIKKPSISKICENLVIFLSLTDPPYKTTGLIILKFFLN